MDGAFKPFHDVSSLSVLALISLPIDIDPPSVEIINAETGFYINFPRKSNKNRRGLAPLFFNNVCQ
jgi:hypothetical protein